MISKTEREALAEVNRLRQDWGLGDDLIHLPPGERHEAMSCPVSVALNGATVTRHVIDGRDFDDFGTATHCVQPSPPIKRFLKLFDSGRCFKHLDVRA